MSEAGIFELVRMGGPLMWAIIAASVLAIGVFLERLIYYHRCAMPLDPFLKAVGGLLRQKRVEEALDRCDEAYGPSARVIQAAIVKRHLAKDDLKELVQEVAQLQMPRLEAHLPMLATIAYVCPLLGLLGTVTGMIDAFMKINQGAGAAPVSDLAAGIWEALITTAGGLSVAIPAYIAHNFLVVRLQAIINDMERAGIEIVQILKFVSDSRPEASSGPAAAPTSAPISASPATPAKSDPPAISDAQGKTSGAASAPPPAPKS